MLDGHILVDAHVHVPVLGSVRPAWIQWAKEFGPSGLLDELWDTDGRPKPAALDRVFEEQGVDAALLFCEYSPKATGYQTFDDLLPIVEHNPGRFRPVANVNPHLHFPIAEEVRRQLDLGAAALKLHPVHGGFRCDDAALYPAYQVLIERGVPLIVHCGTSSFPGSMNELADPAYLLPVARTFPDLDIVLAHGGRGWWYDAAGFMALSHAHVWIELSGLPPKRLPEYYHRYDLRRLARKWIFATDWPGVPGTATNARAVIDLGLDDELAGLVLGGNARQVYAGLDHLFPEWAFLMPIYALGDHVPDIHPDAYVHPDAVVIGRVVLGAESTVWPGAVLRGDFGNIRVGARTSIQDGTVLHTTVEWPTVVGDECVIGHNVHMEGCTVEDRCLIGSGSIVLNRARVGARSVVGAQALVAEDSQIPRGSMALGVPARVRPVDPAKQQKWIDFAVREYVDNGRVYAKDLRLVSAAGTNA